ncbi:MAG: acetyltransferase [Planctomycetes bacterium]|nr:acetyltransferase [Planctomycetota bacterium]
MPTHIILIGGGGHALVVAEAATLAGHALAGFVDDQPPALLERLGVCSRLGTLESLAQFSGPRILCIGDVNCRRRLAARIDLTNAFNVIHPTAFVSPSARLGKGIYVGPNAVIHSRASVGDHAIINSGAIVEHECTVGTHCHIAPAAALGGNVSIGPGSLVGLGARILPSITIGDGAIIGAGSVVVEDVGNGAKVKGVPAR